MVHNREREAALRNSVEKYLTLELVEVGQGRFAQRGQDVVLDVVEVGLSSGRCPLRKPHGQKSLAGEPSNGKTITVRSSLCYLGKNAAQFFLSFPFAQLRLFAQFDA